jgi:hypothetical protein
VANQSSAPFSLYNGTLPNGSRAEGAVLNRISAIERQNSSLNDNIQRQERRLVQRERLLRLQFERMEKTLSTLKNQGSFCKASSPVPWVGDRRSSRTQPPRRVSTSAGAEP